MLITYKQKKGSWVKPGNKVHPNKVSYCEFINEIVNSEKQGEGVHHKTYLLWIFCCITAAIFKDMKILPKDMKLF